MRHEEHVKVLAALKPLAEIWQAYLANNLDDEARRFWGLENQHENQTLPRDNEIYAGRGGKCLLTLEDCRMAQVTIDYIGRS